MSTLIVANLELKDASCWIGLKFNNGTSSWEWENNQKLNLAVGDPTNWAFDGQTPNPNQQAAGLMQYCALIIKDQGERKWAIANCEFSSMDYMSHCALCRNPYYIPAPTPAPSRAPTDNPSKRPSASPTKPPTTKSPTGNPTQRPTTPPTKPPTTKSPTNSPSKRPTTSPTKPPTTKSPTKSPTTRPPTKSPTTKSPTNNPSTRPTTSPTKSPTTKTPTAPPTTKSPSSNPSTSPSKSPTRSPTTKSPTNNPSTRPTTSPTKSPTTKSPTASPTTKSPTAPPTSKSPTNNPSDIPTTSPTKAPTTKQPTANPSDIPSTSPTRSPTTKQPTSNPSKSPTKSPTRSPTTDNPTPSPTDIPTLSPTTPMPTHPDQQFFCGDTHNGSYSAAPVYFNIQTHFTGDIIFDAQASTFAAGLGSIVCRKESELGDIIDSTSNSALTLTVFDQPSGNYHFTLEASTPVSGTYDMNINCVSDSPTPAPTTIPTSQPSQSPSKSPTKSPSNNPTPAPTSNPSDSPTPAPTGNPTPAPTTNPSDSPTTKQPTTSPSTIPSTSPTESPVTTSPTESPTTKTPSTSPTTKPSTSPTQSPVTTPPTDSPTTKTPSTSPTNIPTNNPTQSPTTKSPTDNPSTSPTTSQPSNNPSATPTSNPSDSPTTKSPSTSPTKPPTTDDPTASPTTKSPTKSPTTKTPTNNPTTKPSSSPIKQPTNNPSTSPTTNPSISPTITTDPPSISPSRQPSPQPTRSPTGDDDPCGDDRKEWSIDFPCAGQPVFQLTSLCNDGYAIRVGLDKIFEVNERKRGIGSQCNKFGRYKTWRRDLDFQWDSNEGDRVGMYTVDGQQKKDEREVIVNKFHARLNRRLRGGRGGRKMKKNAWMNITVFFFIDERGGTFDLRNTGQPSDYVTVEAFTLKYIIDSVNWPFKRKSDKLAMQFTVALLDVGAGQSSLLPRCSYDGSVTTGYHGNNGYGPKGKGKSKGKGKGKGSAGFGNPWSGYHYKSKSSSKKSSKRHLLHRNDWRRNEINWGEYAGNALTFANAVSDITDNYAFGVDFRLETVIKALVDLFEDSIELDFVADTWDKVTMIHYFPRFKTLQYDGASIYYLPTFNYWQQRDVTLILDASSNENDGNHRAFAGQDIESQPQFKTKDVESENGMMTKLWGSMSLMNWMFVFGGVLLLAVCMCSCCVWICYKIKQNTHENNSFVKLE